jgi:hypothetical protein
MTRSPLDESGRRYGGCLTIPEFFAEPCGAHMRLMRQCLDCRATLWRILRMFQPTSCSTSMHGNRPTCQAWRQSVCRLFGDRVRGFYAV